MSPHESPQKALNLLFLNTHTHTQYLYISLFWESQNTLLRMRNESQSINIRPRWSFKHVKCLPISSINSEVERGFLAPNIMNTKHNRYNLPKKLHRKGKKRENNTANYSILYRN